jgi:type IV pilus assembly protein PilC
MSKFSQKEQILFAKRLGFLMKAGVPILESLVLLKKQMKSKNANKMFEKIILDVSGGRFLSASLEKFHGTFGDFAVNIIKVGEQSGILSQNLDYLAEELRKKQQMRRKIIGALFYPIFIVAATLVLTLVLTIFVFPKVLPIFSSVNLDLPVSTKILIFASDFLIKFGWLLAIVLIVVSAAVIFFMKRPKFKMLVEHLILNIPLAGGISQNYYLSNFCRTLGLLIKGDFRLDEAIRTTANATENLVYRNEFQKLAVFVDRGEKMSAYLESNKNLFPIMLGHMVAIGEASGNLSETFLYLADLYESEVDELTKNLSGMVEPVLMVFMGLLVGFVAISIITPIYAVTQKLHS